MAAVVTIAGSRDNAAADLHEKVRAVLPQIAANAERTEQERKIPDENIALLRETGSFARFSPSAMAALRAAFSNLARRSSISRKLAPPPAGSPACWPSTSTRSRFSHAKPRTRSGAPMAVKI